MRHLDKRWLGSGVPAGKRRRPDSQASGAVPLSTRSSGRPVGSDSVDGAGGVDVDRVEQSSDAKEAEDRKGTSGAGPGEVIAAVLSTDKSVCGFARCNSAVYVTQMEQARENADKLFNGEDPVALLALTGAQAVAVQSFLATANLGAPPGTAVWAGKVADGTAKAVIGGKHGNDLAGFLWQLRDTTSDKEELVVQSL